jgi:soluble cytochrome b562
MPRLLAIIPEDGWALVSDGDTIFFVHPPFHSSDRLPVPEATLVEAIAMHGYEAEPNVPEESWERTDERIREIMSSSRDCEKLPTDSELLVRMLQSGPPSVLTGLMDSAADWLAKGNLGAAEHALKALLTEKRVKHSKALLDRAIALSQRLDELRD